MSEHAVIVHLPFPDSVDVSDVHALEDELVEAIETAGAGEFDGDEFGGGECTLYMYGPDADRLFDSIATILRSSPLTAGGHAIKRYGAAADPTAKETRIELSDTT
jgi:hypothetical protein